MSARLGRHLQTVWCPLHHHGHDGQVEEGCHGQDQDRGGGGGQRGPSGPGQLTASTGCQHQLGDIFFSWGQEVRGDRRLENNQVQEVV